MTGQLQPQWNNFYVWCQRHFLRCWVTSTKNQLACLTQLIVVEEAFSQPLNHRPLCLTCRYFRLVTGTTLERWSLFLVVSLGWGTRFQWGSQSESVGLFHRFRFSRAAICAKLGTKRQNLLPKSRKDWSSEIWVGLFITWILSMVCFNIASCPVLVKLPLNLVVS